MPNGWLPFVLGLVPLCSALGDVRAESSGDESQPQRQRHWTFLLDMSQVRWILHPVCVLKAGCVLEHPSEEEPGFKNAAVASKHK